MRIGYFHPTKMRTFRTQVRKIAGVAERCMTLNRYGFENCRKIGETASAGRREMGLAKAATPVPDRDEVIRICCSDRCFHALRRAKSVKRFAGAFLSGEKQVGLPGRMKMTEQAIIRVGAHLVLRCALASVC